jgi:serine/threonine protein kinase
MAERCPACHAHVDDAQLIGGVLRCEKCGMRFPTSRKGPDPGSWSLRDDVDGLGIHPALARKYRRAQSGPGAPAGDTPPPSAYEPPSSTEIEPAGRRRLRPHEASTPPPRPAVTSSSPMAMQAGLATGVPLRDPFGSGPRADPDSGTQPARPSRRGSSHPAEQQRAPVFEEQLPEIPGYILEELVGKGAMGRVFRATQEGTGRPAAVKVLAPELAAREDFVARFEREAAALRAVEHPGVVAIFDSGSLDDAHYLCMEFIDGVPLRRLLENGIMPPLQALSVARRIVQGLGAAHERGVIHRDLKPENILVEGDASVFDDDARLVLVDFGLAGIVHEENDPHPNLTKSRMTMGTVNYMAPEQRTDAKRVDHRADLYAAGVILYELLTGDLPLGRFALPTERGLSLPSSTDRCIVHALARNPDERYQSAAELDADLAIIEAEITHGPMPERAAVREHDATTPGEVVHVRAHDVEKKKRAAFTTGLRSLHAPKWVTAPPWVKRPALLWAVGALSTGVLLSLLSLRTGCADVPPPRAASAASSGP